MILDPMDELMEANQDFIATYDHGLEIPDSLVPPVQGGFLLFKPNKTDFEAIKKLTRDGDFRDSTGWKGSDIGWAYGGTGPVGLLAYYFHKDGLREIKKVGKQQLPEGLMNLDHQVAGVKMLAVDRAVYDVVIDDRLRSDLQKSDHAAVVARVKSVHFTGNYCPTPWSCDPISDSLEWLCKAMVDKWWELRAEVEQERGLPRSPMHCRSFQYKPLTA